jgi:hypothetical protein
MTGGTARLVGDCGGPIAEIAMTVPLRILEKTDGLKAAALGNLARALPQDVTLYLMTDDPAADAFKGWLAGLDLACTPIVIGAGDRAPLLESEMWSQDPWMAAESGGAPLLHHLRHTDRPGRQALLFAAFGQVEVVEPEIQLAGGNTLTGLDFRLLGTLSVELTRRLGPHPMSAEEALARHQALDVRPIHVFGFPLPAKPGTPVELRQQPHHLDLVLSVTGLRSQEGRPLLLLADPRSSTDPLGPRTPGWAEQLDSSAARLEAAGFAVKRNPVPYVAHPRFSPNPNLRAYNNVLLENARRRDLGRTRPLVWLPQFGDLEPDLAPFDRANGDIWAGLGFEPVPVPGWSALVRAGGALRCASKVLSRRATEPALA